VKKIFGPNGKGGPVREKVVKLVMVEVIKILLFIRGSAMSAARSIKGTNQFPNPTIRFAITIKKIITKAWAVTTTL
jgi:hypothetical protein